MPPWRWPTGWSHAVRLPPQGRRRCGQVAKAIRKRKVARGPGAPGFGTVAPKARSGAFTRPHPRRRPRLARAGPAAAAALAPTQFADDFRLMTISRVPLGTLARHQRPTADGADDVITRGNPPSAGPLARSTLVVRNRCDRCRCRPLARKPLQLKRLPITLHAIRTRLRCSLREPSVLHRPTLPCPL